MFEPAACAHARLSFFFRNSRTLNLSRARERFGVEDDDISRVCACQKGVGDPLAGI